MLAKRFYYACAGILLFALALLATPPPAPAEGGYVFLTQWGSFGGGNGQFEYPEDVAVDAAGNVYVADAERHRIQRFGPDVTAANGLSWGGVKARYRP